MVGLGHGFCEDAARRRADGCAHNGVFEQTLAHGEWLLLDGDGFREIPRLINIVPFRDTDVVREKLKRNGGQKR